jgi:hypothetical protein
MSSPVDPVGTEIEGIHELVYFSDADVLAGGAGMAHDLAIRGRGSHRARHRYEREKIKRAAEAIPPSLRSKLNFFVAYMLIGVIEASKSPITEHVS